VEKKIFEKGGGEGEYDQAEKGGRLIEERSRSGNWGGGMVSRKRRKSVGISKSKD